MCKTHLIKFTLATFLSVLIINITWAQSNLPNDSTAYYTSINKLTNVFRKSVNEQQGLYNGNEYLFYSAAIKGTPYTLKKWTNGSLTYNGIAYNNIPMLYDMYLDQVAILTYYELSQIALNSKKISQFDLDGHHYIFLTTDSLHNTSAKSGFYDQIYKGRTQVLVKRFVTLETRAGKESSKVESVFVLHNDLYIKKGNSLYKIGGQSALIDALKDQEKSLKQYIKDNNIRYKDDAEQALVAIASYYDRLTN